MTSPPSSRLVPLVRVAQVDDEGARRQQVGQRGRLCQRHVVDGSVRVPPATDSLRKLAMLDLCQCMARQLLSNIISLKAPGLFFGW